ncbi:MAG: rhomboid family intramembrane serine protease [Candidatus Thorarchaeota archaeon]
MMVLDVDNLKDAKITLFLIFTNIFVYFFITIAIPNSLYYIVQINRLVLEDYEYWRLITSIFIHGDLIHLFSNMFGLFLFGVTVETNKLISKLQYLIIYFISGIIGNIFTLFLLPINTISLGASGAIFGLLGVAFIMIATDYQPLIFFALFYIIFFIATSFAPGINYWAHLFGLLGGLFFGYIFYWRKRDLINNY